ncbi:MAG: YqgE/AlgH family protein [Pseudomonadota bacterium]
MDLNNQFIIAMPNLHDPQFQRSVTYICQHNQQGSLGITINRPINMNLSDLFAYMQIPLEDQFIANTPVFSGGPVEPNQGFVLHSADKSWEHSLTINDDFVLSSSKDVLQAIGIGEGPENYLIAMGYAGWGEGHLEKEISENSWLNCQADKNIVFHLNYNKRWQAAAQLMGVDITLISSEAGHA